MRRAVRAEEYAPPRRGDGMYAPGLREPLALYHGLTGSGERWRDTGNTAGLATANLIPIDARDHGRSDKPRDQAA
jgi:pimeloyl-ACP methyl ester carboxylesterase